MSSYMVIDTGKDGCVLTVDRTTHQPKSVYYFKEGYRKGFIDVFDFLEEVERWDVRHFYIERVPLILHGSNVSAFAVQHQIIGQIYGAVMSVDRFVIDETYPASILACAKRFLASELRLEDSKKISQNVAKKIFSDFYLKHKKRTKVHEALADTLMHLAFIRRSELADLFED